MVQKKIFVLYLQFFYKFEIVSKKNPVHWDLLGKLNEVEMWIYIFSPKKSRNNNNSLDTSYG